MKDDDDQLACEQPCHPNSGCPVCKGYWEEMKREGFWDGNKWTDKGIRERSK
jgi:hypothetical protein